MRFPAAAAGSGAYCPLIAPLTAPLIAAPEDNLTIDHGSSPPDVADDGMPPARDPSADFPPSPGSSALGVPKSRCCLKCQATFHSEWSGARLCPRCKSKSGWRHGR
jgi:hypothetical protein